MSTTDVARELFSAPNFAHLAIVDGKGQPHNTPIWVDVADDGTIWFNTAIGRVKDKALPEGAPLALSVHDPANPYRYVEVRGTVGERRTGDVAERDIDRLAKKYMDADSYPLRKDGEHRVTVVVAPDKVSGSTE